MVVRGTSVSRELELLTRDALVDANVAVRALHHVLVGELRRLLVLLGIEAHLEKSVPHVLLGKLFDLELRLRLHDVSDRLVLASGHLSRDLWVLLLPLLHVAEPRGVRGVHLVDDVELALLVKAELVLGVDEDEALLAH